MIRSFHLRPDGALDRDLSVEQMRKILASREGVLWVDLEAPTAEENAILGPALFGFHPLAIEDCLEAQSRPKVNDFEEYLYVVFHAWTRDDEGVRLEEVDFFLGAHFLVSHHHERRRSILDVEEKTLRDPRAVLGHGADLLLHQILDRMIDRYDVVVDDLETRAEELELGILAEDRRDRALREILDLRRDLQELFRTIRHQRDVVSALVREGGHRVVSKRGKQFFRAVYDSVVRVHDTVESLREQVAGSRDAYLALASHRMNEVMKGLSVIATLMLPLTFITGLYGMNFAEMPMIRERSGFWIICAVMATLAAGMLAVFRARHWL